MAKKSKQDVATAKAAKQKKIAIIGAVVFVLVAAIQVPRTMKMLNKKPKPPVVALADGTSTVSTTPDTTAVPVDPNSLAAPSLAGSAAAVAPAAAAASSADLVSAVPVSADTGQLQTFERFATKDPFVAQVAAGGTASSSSSSSSSSPKPAGQTGGSTLTVTPPPQQPSTSQQPTAPAAPTTAVISVNGEVGSVSVGTDFPVSGVVFSRVGSIFHLVSLTGKTAKIAIAGGSYADGSQAITLQLGKPLTLQNTADGTKYTLILEPPTTPVTGTGATTGGISTTPSVPVVPSSGSGG